MGQDITYLRKMWQQIRDSSKRQPAPSLLHAELSLAQRALRDLSTQETTHIRVDAKGQLAELQTFAATFTPDTLEKLSLYTG